MVREVLAVFSGLFPFRVGRPLSGARGSRPNAVAGGLFVERPQAAGFEDAGQMSFCGVVERLPVWACRKNAQSPPFRIQAVAEGLPPARCFSTL